MGAVGGGVLCVSKLQTIYDDHSRPFLIEARHVIKKNKQNASWPSSSEGKETRLNNRQFSESHMRLCA